MDPAMPDWRAFGQATTAAPPEPARPEGRTDAAAAWVRRLPRTTLIALIATVVLAVGGVALALGTPTGGDITLSGDGTEGPAMGPMGATGAARSVVDGPAVPIATELVVDVAGGVARPGLVRLAGGSRVGDAIAAAGGYAASADLAAAAVALNLAAPVHDGEKVLVPELGTTAPTDPGAPARDVAAGGRVDLNTASASDLDALPGIGPVTAERIIEARAQAPFTTVEELRSRGLLGESAFGKVRDLVSAGS